MANNYYDRTDAEALAKLHIEAKKTALSLVPAVAEVLQKFDGKQANKRLDTALKKIDNGLVFKMANNSFIVEWRIDKRDARKSDSPGIAIYIDDYAVTLLQASAQSYGSRGDGILDGGTINAALAIEWLEKYAAIIKESIETAEEQLGKVAEILAERESLKNKVEQHNKGISPILNRYFNLKIEMGWR